MEKIGKMLFNHKIIKYCCIVCYILIFLVGLLFILNFLILEIQNKDVDIKTICIFVLLLLALPLLLTLLMYFPYTLANINSNIEKIEENTKATDLYLKIVLEELNSKKTIKMKNELIKETCLDKNENVLEKVNDNVKKNTENKIKDELKQVNNYSKLDKLKQYIFKSLDDIYYSSSSLEEKKNKLNNLKYEGTIIDNKLYNIFKLRLTEVTNDHELKNIINMFKTVIM